MHLAIPTSILALLSGAVTCNAAYTLNPGAIPASGSFSYTQNFNTIPDTGWQNDSTLAGWILVGPETPANYAKDNGSGSSGSFYNYGSTGSPDRALGTLTAKNGSTRTIAFVVQNTTGSTVRLDNIQFQGEQWRAGNKSTDKLEFRMLTSATSPTDAQINTWAAGSAGMITQLDFVTNSGNKDGALDGNAAANSASRAQSVSQNVANGEYLVFLWTDKKSPAHDDGMAIDDFVATFSSPTAPIPEPGSVSLFAGSAALAIWARRRRQLPA